MKSQQYKKYESSFDRKAAKAQQNYARQLRETSKLTALNTVEDDDDYSDIRDPWEDQDEE